MQYELATLNLMDIKNTRIGIWGYGVVGKSAICYLRQFTPHLALYDKQSVSAQEQTSLTAQGITLYAPEALDQFLQQHDYILPSPGIDLRPYAQYHAKFISEFDLFRTSWHKPLIAITGSIGKTTTTHLISAFLQKRGVAVATGGNIGTAMLDLLATQATHATAVLELSSFQLESITAPGPDLAIITNLHPNHLDRHGSFEAYAGAKYRMIRNQKEDGIALLPLALAISIRQHVLTPRSYIFLSEQEPSAHELSTLEAQDTVYYYTPDKLLMKLHHGTVTQLTQCAAPAITFTGNLLLVQTVLALLHYDPTITPLEAESITLPAHRLAPVAVHQGVTFYNDSKATIPEAMLAAMKKVSGSPTLLFLGGVSKGVDRSPSIAALRGSSVKHIFCFGKEAETLKTLCEQNQLSATAYTDLHTAFADCVTHYCAPGDVVLFSPAGASFDLFTDYQARGRAFEALVAAHIQNQSSCSNNG